jgi:hypothetical protein
MTGREDKKHNDLFFVCALIEYIARKTKNHRNVVVNAIGKQQLQHLYDLADIYHSENMDKISDELIDKYHIEEGYFDNVAESNYDVPAIWDIGKVYKRLIIDIMNESDTDRAIDVLTEVYNSWLSRKLEDFNSSLFYENPDYIFQSYMAGQELV